MRRKLRAVVIFLLTMLLLSQYGMAQDVTASRQQLANVDPAVRVAAVMALADAHDPQAPDLLLAALSDHDIGVRYFVVRLLTEIPNPRAATMLASILCVRMIVVYVNMQSRHWWQSVFQQLKRYFHYLIIITLILLQSLFVYMRSETPGL